MWHLVDYIIQFHEISKPPALDSLSSYCLGSMNGRPSPSVLGKKRSCTYWNGTILSLVMRVSAGYTRRHSPCSGGFGLCHSLFLPKSHPSPISGGSRGSRSSVGTATSGQMAVPNSLHVVKPMVLHLETGGGLFANQLMNEFQECPVACGCRRRTRTARSLYTLQPTVVPNQRSMI